MQIIVRKAHSIRLAGIFDVLHGRRSRLAKFSIVPLLILAAASLAIFMAGTQWAFQHACKVYCDAVMIVHQTSHWQYLQSHPSEQHTHTKTFSFVRALAQANPLSGARWRGVWHQIKTC